MFQSWKGVVVVCACLGLLGTLAFCKVDGAAVAAIAAVTTIVAWLTRAPSKEDPPPGASLVPLVAVGSILAGLLGQGCAMLAAEKAAATGAYAAQQLKCVDDEPAPAPSASAAEHAAARARVDACRARVKEEWARADAATSADGAR